MAGRRRRTSEQVVRMLGEAGRFLGGGASVAGVVWRLGVSEQRFRRWRDQSGGLKAGGVERLKGLEAENARLKRIMADKARLKRIVADKEMGIGAWREIGRSKW